MDIPWTDFLTAAAAIIGIDLLLSGDNAVVIALACRNLPERQRRLGVLLGALTAVAMRLAFAFGLSSIMGLSWLHVIGAALLLWIAIKLVQPEGDEHKDVSGRGSLLGAIWTIAIADLVMSFDNVLAIVAIAKGNMALIAFGLLLSVPLVMAGATLILRLVDRFPVLVWAGAGVLGWVAGDLAANDPALVGRLPELLPHRAFEAGGALIVLVGGYLWRRARGVRGLSV